MLLVSPRQRLFLELAFLFAVDALVEVFLAREDVAFRLLERFAAGFFLVDLAAVDVLDVVVRDVGLLEPAFLELERLALDLLVPDVFRLGALRPPAFAAFVLTFSETSSAWSTAIASILSATVLTRSCAASVESSFLPALTAVSFMPFFAMGSVLSRGAF